MTHRISILLIFLVVLVAFSFGQTANLVLPGNGGVLESFTSERDANYPASRLTDGVTNDAGWSSSLNPGTQEFNYSFRNGHNAILQDIIVYSGNAEGLYFSEGIEIWVSGNSIDYSLAASGTLANTPDTLNVSLGGLTARSIRLVITSGYHADYWELGEFVVNGVIDTIPPTINLTGADSVTVYFGEAFTDPGAIATDNEDGDISAGIVISGAVNSDSVGTYTLYYNISDLSGNTANEVTRVVSVIDTIAPVITLVGTDSLTVYYGEAFLDSGATANDNADGDISADIIISGNVVMDSVESYTLQYNVSDQSGNAATEVTKTVYVTDTTPPVITLTGGDTIIIYYGEPYAEAGASAFDNADGDLSSNIVISGSVDSSVVGSYAISYNVIDYSGNAASSLTRTVNVIDTMAPSITLVGADTVIVYYGESYTETGASASDNADGNLSSNIVISGSVDSNIVGSYIIRYNVVDFSGNAAIEVNRIVNVVDTTPPVLTLIGSDTLSLFYNQPYIEPGVIAIDNADGNISTNIVISDSVITDSIGTYTLQYNVSDQSGNMATEIYRAVHVNTLPVDFESGPYNIENFGGGYLTIITNPQPGGINTSATVARHIKGVGAEWSGSLISLPAPIDFTHYQGISMKILSPRSGVSVLLKVEDSNNTNNFIERSLSTTTENTWETLYFDFSGATTGIYDRLVFILDMGIRGDGSSNYTFLLDDIALFRLSSGADASLSNIQIDSVPIAGFSPDFLNYNIDLANDTVDIPTISVTPRDTNASYIINQATAIPGTASIVVTAENGISTATYAINFDTLPASYLPIDFEEGPYSITNFDGGELTVIDNPQSSGINTSNRVGHFIKGSGQPWAGSYISLPTPINFSLKQGVAMKVFSPRAGASVLMKLEHATNPGIYIERTLYTSVSNEWDSLSFLFTEAESGLYSKIVFIFDLGISGDGSDNFTFLIDDIELFGNIVGVNSLTVNNGEGDGKYTAGIIITLTADPALIGMEFDRWVTDSGSLSISNIFEPITNLTMPTYAASVTATYKPILYELTVNNGSGDGLYGMDSIASIIADTAVIGQEFEGWIVNYGGAIIADVNSPMTTLTMQTSPAVVTAAYKASLYSLTVNNGSGDGLYQYSTALTISANTAPVGEEFDHWEVIYGNLTIIDSSSSNTTLIMGADSARIEAIYRPTSFILTVNNGSGDGGYESGASAIITADPAPAGMEFDVWIVNFGSPTLTDPNTSSTTLTMGPHNTTVTAQYRASTYPLVVNNGSGDGNFEADATITIVADKAPIGQEFDKWVVNSGIPNIANANASSTTLVMPIDGTTITARYKASWYSLTVNNGSGDTLYTYGSKVTIIADAAPIGQEFDTWIVNFGSPTLTDPNHSSTSLMMPPGDATVTASYKLSSYNLSVNAGSGDGFYTAGTSVIIIADPASAEQVFDKWIVDSGNAIISDVNNPSTTLSMPIGDAFISATYKTATYPLTINNGNGDGAYESGAYVLITANAAPLNMEFDQWVISNGTPLIADKYATSTNISMSSGATTINATFKPSVYDLTVNNGDGDGYYELGTIVNIIADPAPAGMLFDRWQADYGSPEISDVYSMSTTLTMPLGASTISVRYIPVTEFNGNISFWADGLPYINNLITEVRPAGMNEPVVYPSADGAFTWDITNGSSINITRDIPSGTSVMSDINGYDAYLASKVTINDTSYIPSVYQLIAMDVNRDGRISAGDISMISQRAVGNRVEFTSNTGAASPDWIFVANEVVRNDPQYEPSKIFPLSDGTGYSKSSVPVPAINIAIPVEDSTGLLIIDRALYRSILLGDVFSESDITQSGFKSTQSGNSEIIIDLNNIHRNNEIIDIPLFILSDNEVHSIDFSIDYNAAVLELQTVIDHADISETFYSDGTNVKTSSYSSNKSIGNGKVFSLQFITHDYLSNNDLIFEAGIINGQKVNTKIISASEKITGVNYLSFNSVNIYPNPANDKVFIEFEGSADIALINSLGQILTIQNEVRNELSIDLSQLPKGLYTIMVNSRAYPIAIID
jgi:hypothetical protein